MSCVDPASFGEIWVSIQQPWFRSFDGRTGLLFDDGWTHAFDGVCWRSGLYRKTLAGEGEL
jgi:hypothetical protein